MLMGGASREHLLQLAAIELLALPVLGLALVRLVRTGVWKEHRFLLILAGLATALPLFQLIPLPFDLWSSLPGRDQAALALEIAGITPGWLPLSLAPDETWQAFLALLPPVAMLLAALTLDRATVMRLVWGVLAFVVLSIVLGALQITLDSQTFYLWETTNFGSLVGFFANRNHMATLCLLAVPFAAALAGSGLNSRDPHAGLRAWVGMLIIVLVLVALAAIRSRFGILAAGPALIGGLLAAWVASGRGRPTPPVIALAGAAAVALGIIVLFALGPILDRFDTDPATDLRFENWPIVAQAAQDFLPLGSGIGSFDAVYRSYEPVDTLRAAYFNHAHNDYLQMWLTTGWMGIALIVATWVWWARRSWSAWRAGTGLERDLQRAASVALLVIAAHSAADYPMRTETIAVIFALCCAVLDGAARPLRRSEQRRRA
ncbi:O-antigen ligase family protein [Brevundimonas sp.]|uniref:O-antigen ligase family protein n=1 Tax=Brevundimonas sp. TaxID=1871086 RepID=UPI001E0B516A|nr:O-antigen ligase family protein [Brevundimonas sp.]MBL0946712.1 O-antigen ligase family protein [Brevundimonas sp.]